MGNGLRIADFMENLSKYLTESREIEYRVSLIGCTDRENLPISVTILVDKNDSKWFESYLEEEQGNLFSHAEGGNIEY